MAVAPEVRDADKEARVALLNKITKEVDGGSYNLLDLAKAYNLVTASDAPSDPAKVRTGGFA